LAATRKHYANDAASFCKLLQELPTFLTAAFILFYFILQ